MASSRPNRSRSLAAGDLCFTQGRGCGPGYIIASGFIVLQRRFGAGCVCRSCPPINRRGEAQGSKARIAMRHKPWTKMTAAELAEATREFDHGTGPAARSPTAREAAKQRLAMRTASKRQRGRPRLGEGAARVLFTIDPNLLIRLDVFARKHGVKRSQLIAQSVEAYMRQGIAGVGRSRRAAG
jgi:hypothetical protein